MQIRPFRNADRAALIALWEAAGLVRPWNDPDADIDLAMRTDTATLLVAEDADGALVGGVMTGFDGHRGWLYYLASHPAQRGSGVGRALAGAAEAHLRDLGCPKVEAIVRRENDAADAFYRSIGYHREPRRLFSKWLIEPPAPQLESLSAEDDSPDAVDGEVPTLDVTVTWLEMTEPPSRPPLPQPGSDKPLSLTRLHEPPVDYYRFIRHAIGDPWLWWVRRELTDAQLAEIVHDDAVEIYVLHLGGAPAGFAELDFRKSPEVANLAYLGLMQWCIGRGFGPYLLDWAIRRAWEREPRPKRLTVDTCTLDHPKALAGYQKAGFQVYDRTTSAVPDPRARGLTPPHATVLSDVPPYPR